MALGMPYGSMGSSTMEIRRLMILVLLWLCDLESALGRQYFKERPSNVTVVQGGDAVLRCVIGDRKGQVNWVKDGGAMGEGLSFPGYPRYSVVGNSEFGEYHFRIIDAKLEDDDEYECQVGPEPDDEHSLLRAKAYIIILVPPNNVSFDGVQRDGRVEVKVDGTLDVACKANGAKPAAELRWYRNGHRLADQFLEVSHDVEDEKRFTTISRLRLRATAADNGAIFTCEAGHQALSHSRPLQSQFILSVIYPPGIPHITGHDVARTLVAGDHVHLRCMAENGNPPPSLIWYRNGVSVSRNYTYTQGYTKNEYSFHAQASDNEADFRCEASNLATVSPLSASIRLQVYFAPERVIVSGRQDAKFGDTVHFTCQASASFPDAKLEWLIDGEQYYDHTSRRLPANDTRYSRIGTETSSSLSFKITRRRPEMTVTCRAINEHLPQSHNREVTDSKKLKVSYPPQSVKITVNREDRKFVAGDMASMKCEAIGGNPTPVIEWLRKDQKVASGFSTKYDPELDAAISEYSFVVSQDDNMREIKCRAHTQSVGGDSASVILQVQFPPDSATMSQNPFDVEAEKQVELYCESGSANPAPIVAWYHNGKKLDSTTAQNVTSTNGGWRVKEKLTLVPTKQDNGVEYECRVWSPIMDVSKAIKKTKKLEVLHKPIFVVPVVQHYEVLEGESVIVNASAYGNPKVAQYTWHKNTAPSKALRSEFRSSSDTTGHWRLVNGSVMEIRRVERGDAGTYTCTATNRIGTSSMNATLVVKYPARITHITSTLYANISGSVTLSCDVAAYPLPYNVARWERADGDDMRDPRFIRNFTKGSAKLLISGIQREDTGIYSCIADNGIGQPYLNSTQILVRQPPILDHSSIYAKAAAPLGNNAELTCVAIGIPDVKFSWQRDTRTGTDLNRRSQLPLVTETDRISVSSKKIGFMRYQGQMTIRGVQEKDYGTYRCIAENDLGSKSMEVKFGKPEPPEQPTGIRILNKTHDSLTLDWLPGFNGGLEQKFVIRYRMAGSTFRSGHETQMTIQTKATTLTIDSLKPQTTYIFAIQAVNDVGHSGFSNETVETLGPASIIQESTKEELPVLIIVLVCLVGIILLVLNAGLVVCFLRRHRRKKLEERAASARLGSSSGRKIQMYSSETGAGAAALYQRDEKYAVDGDGQRPRSAMSDGNGSVRTVIEVDGSDGQNGFATAAGSPRLHGYLLDAVNDEFDDDVPSDFNYAEALRTNTLQRQLANGVYNVPEASIRNGLDRNRNTYVAAQAVDDILPPSAPGPLRDTINQEYGPYASYQPVSGNRTLERKYSPTHSAQLHSNGRTPYAEVRPLLSNAGPVDAIPPHGSPVRNNRAHAGSPILSTFAALPLRTDMQEEFEEDADSLSGDLV